MMPLLNQLRCTVELGSGNIALKEYRRQYGNGSVETFIAVPSTSIPFSIHVTSTGYIASGLAVFVYIDGDYQANRNRCHLTEPGDGIDKDAYEIDFRFRQKEEKVASGLFVGREWTFVELDTTTADGAPQVSERFLHNVGTIEVVVLRCKGGKLASKSAPAGKVVVINKAPRPSSDRHKSPTSQKSDFGGGWFGLFDGAGADDMRRSVAVRTSQQHISPNDCRYWSRINPRGNYLDGNGVERIANGARAGHEEHMFTNEEREQHLRHITRLEAEHRPWHGGIDTARGTWSRGPTEAAGNFNGTYQYHNGAFPRPEYGREALVPRYHPMQQPVPHNMGCRPTYSSFIDYGRPVQKTASGLGNTYDSTHGFQYQEPYNATAGHHTSTRHVSNLEKSEIGASKEATIKNKRLEQRYEKLIAEVKALLGTVDSVDEKNKTGALAERERNELDKEMFRLRDQVNAVYQDMAEVKERLKTTTTTPGPEWATYNPGNEGYRNYPSANLHGRSFEKPDHGYGGFGYGGGCAGLSWYDPYGRQRPAGHAGFHQHHPQVSIVDANSVKHDKNLHGSKVHLKGEGGKDRNKDMTDEKNNTNNPWATNEPENKSRDDNPWATNGLEKNSKDDNPWATNESEKNSKDDNPWGKSSSEEKQNEQTTDWANKSGAGNEWADFNNENNNDWGGEQQDNHDGWNDSKSDASETDQHGWNEDEKAKSRNSTARSSASAGTSSQSTNQTMASPQPKSYWVLNKDSSGSRSATGEGRKPLEHLTRKAYAYATRPLPTIPEKSTDKGVTHGVQAGKGAAYDHATRQPEYLDSMTKPYAIFRFKYRTPASLEKILKKDISEDIAALDRQAGTEFMQALTKDDLITHMLAMGTFGERAQQERGKNGAKDEVSSSSRKKGKKSKAKPDDENGWGEASKKSESKKSASSKQQKGGNTWDNGSGGWNQGNGGTAENQNASW